MKIQVDTEHELSWDRERPDSQTELKIKVQGTCAEITIADQANGWLDKGELKALRAMVSRALRLVK